jgi:hypothetical protein
MAQRDTDDVVWTLRKGDRTAEARTSPNDGINELRIYTGSGSKRDTYGLVSADRTRDAKALRELAEVKKQEFEANGWERD